MKSVLTATAVILAFTSQTFAFNLSCADVRRSLNCYSQQTGCLSSSSSAKSLDIH